MAWERKQTEDAPKIDRKMKNLRNPGDCVCGVLERIRMTRMQGEEVKVVDFMEVDPYDGQPNGQYCTVVFRPGMNELQLPMHSQQRVRLMFKGYERSNQTGRQYKRFVLDTWENDGQGQDEESASGYGFYDNANPFDTPDRNLDENPNRHYSGNNYPDSRFEDRRYSDTERRYISR